MSRWNKPDPIPMEELRRLVCTHTLREIAALYHCSPARVTRVRNAAGIPSRPPNMVYLKQPVPGSDSRTVLDDPELTETVMYRAYSRAGRCPPFCRYFELATCPKVGRRIAAKEEEGDDQEEPCGDGPDLWSLPDEPEETIGMMHEMCPVRHYWGSERNDDARLVVLIKRIADNEQRGKERRLDLARKKRRVFREKVTKTQAEREPDTPETFREFLASL